MKKLAALRAHLLSIPEEITLDPKQVQTFADKGRLVSQANGTNQHFELKYTASIIITNFSGDEMALFFWLLKWVHANQPDLAADAILFEADILNDKEADVSISVDLTENVRVEQTAQGIVLHHCTDPNVIPEPLTAPQWTMNASGTDLLTWVNGGAGG